MTEREEWTLLAQEVYDNLDLEQVAALSLLVAKVRNIVINARVQTGCATVTVSFKEFVEMQKAYERVVGL